MKPKKGEFYRADNETITILGYAEEYDTQNSLVIYRGFKQLKTTVIPVNQFITLSENGTFEKVGKE